MGCGLTWLIYIFLLIFKVLVVYHYYKQAMGCMHRLYAGDGTYL